MCVLTILPFLLLSIAEGEGEENFLRNYYVIKYFGFKSGFVFQLKVITHMKNDCLVVE